MSEPLKPRIDFDGPLQAEKIPPLKGARAFDTLEADNFAPARLVTGEEEEGRRKRWWSRSCDPNAACGGGWSAPDWRSSASASWRKACSGRLTPWQTQDWIALGGCVAGALIVGAGVGSLATEWRRLWRLRQRAHERDEARDMLHSHAVGKAKAFCEKLAQQAGLDQSHPALQRWYAAIHETQSDREVVSLYAQLVQPVLDARGAAGNQPFGGGVDADDCRQPAGAGGYGVYRPAEPAADQPNCHVVRH